MVSWSFVNENLRSRGRVVGERDVTLSTARRELSFKRSMITRCAGSDRVWGLVSGGGGKKEAVKEKGKGELLIQKRELDL